MSKFFARARDLSVSLLNAMAGGPAATKLVRACSFMRFDKDSILAYVGLNGTYQASGEFCNGRPIYVKIANSNVVAWWAHTQQHGMSWCIGPRVPEQEKSSKMWAYTPSDGINPSQNNTRQWMVYCHDSSVWLKQPEACFEAVLTKGSCEDRKCLICCDNAANIVTVPCGHLNVCRDCWKKSGCDFKRCFTCRAVMRQMVLVYI